MILLKIEVHSNRHFFKAVYMAAMMKSALTKHMVTHLFRLKTIYFFLNCLGKSYSNIEEKLSPWLLRYGRKLAINLLLCPYIVTRKGQSGNTDRTGRSTHLC